MEQNIYWDNLYIIQRISLPIRHPILLFNIYSLNFVYLSNVISIIFNGDNEIAIIKRKLTTYYKNCFGFKNPLNNYQSKQMSTPDQHLYLFYLSL